MNNSDTLTKYHPPDLESVDYFSHGKNFSAVLWLKNPMFNNIKIGNISFHKDKKSGINHKRTLLLTIQGPNLYWSYDTKKQKLEIYEDKILD